MNTKSQFIGEDNTGKILVTGGTGFLGSVLCNKLKNLSFEVTAFGRNVDKGHELQKNGISFIQADLTDQEKIDEACKDVDYVFHCGALSSPWGSSKDFYNSNVIGTQNIIRACKKHKIKRLVHISTTSIYFEFKDKYDISETKVLPEKMVNEYAKTKLKAEQEIDKAFHDELAVITIRPSGIFGPGDTSILPRIVKANNKRFIPINKKKEVKVDITYVDNVVEALLLCLNAPTKALGKKYNITNGEPINLYEFLEKLINRLGYEYKPLSLPFPLIYYLAYALEMFCRQLPTSPEPPLTCYSAGVLSFSKTLDITAAKNDLGYTPVVSMEEALERVIEEWKN